jgi:hypothetical protein
MLAMRKNGVADLSQHFDRRYWPLWKQPRGNRRVETAAWKQPRGNSRVETAAWKQAP